jgi:hypothetical protein
MGHSLKDEIEEYVRAGRTGGFWVQLGDQRLGEVTSSVRSSGISASEGMAAFFEFYGCEASDEDFGRIKEALGRKIGGDRFRNDCLEVIIFGLRVSKGDIEGPYNSIMTKLSRSWKFKGKIRGLKKAGH